MKISLYPRAGIFYCRLFSKSTTVRISTNCRDADSAILEMNKIKKIAEANNIQDVKVLYLKSKGDKLSYDLLDLCNNYIDNATVGKIKTKSGTNIKESSLSIYRFSVSVLSKFYDDNGGINLQDYTLDGLESKAKFEIVDSFDGYFARFSEWMEERNYKRNSMANIINNISLMINHYKEKLFINLPRISNIQRYEPPIIVLSEEFLRDFVLNTSYKSIKDRFMWELSCIMLVTSLRISDAISLKPTDILDGFLTKENKKTGSTTSVPIPPILADCIKDNIAKVGTVFCMPASENYYRRNMKSYFKRFEELHKEISINIVDSSGEKQSVTKKMYEWVHPHMLRKTAITCMLANNVSPEHVRFASGHKPNSNSFNRYVGFVNSRFKSEIESYYNKVLR